MSQPNLLTQVQKPGRYVGGEIGSVTKDDRDVRLRVALAFPDVYEIAMSHVGLRILYGLINQRARWWAERVMAPWPDMSDYLRRQGRPLGALESGRPLSEFDLIGFSLQTELNWINLLNMLDLGGVPIRAADRDRGPLVVAGGPNAVNPEPLADFVDFFFLGDAEAGFMEVLEEVERWKEQGGHKRELFETLAGRPGVYVPSFFRPEYDGAGRVAGVVPLRPGYDRVARATIPDLDAAYFPDRPVVPFVTAVHDRISIEIARGCTRGCRFCQAGGIYRPVRERRPETILELIDRNLKATGQDEVSLLSLSAGDYSCLNPLMSAFMDRYSAEYVALALPSLRVKSLTPDVMTQIKRVRKTGFTLAPEAGTQRLRDAINKDLTEDDLLTAARSAFDMGWRLIKLYFMIGLPTETDEDVLAIADLAARLRSGTKARINVSFAAFVPKPHTPFQWEPMIGLDESRRRAELLRGAIRNPALRPKWNPPASSMIEGVLSRGDRRLGPVLAAVHRGGGGFEAWTEHFHQDLWLNAISARGLSVEEYLRGRSLDETLPWAHLEAGPSEAYLKKELARAKKGQTTPDCRSGDCGGCGVCDFNTLAPRLHSEPMEAIPAAEPAVPPAEPDWYRFNYRKKGAARFFSQLELSSILIRAFRRAELILAMSRGYHPQPRLTFHHALPVGYESEDEYFEAQIAGAPETGRLQEQLAAQLPEGLILKGVQPLTPAQRRFKPSAARYRVEADRPLFDKAVFQRKLDQNQVLYTRHTKKGPKTLDVKTLIGGIEVLTPTQVEIIIKYSTEGMLRPTEVLAALTGLPPEQAYCLRVTKRASLFDQPDLKGP
jgi:radical SAM family uncharacterized protein/radical SAM-linked protein